MKTLSWRRRTGEILLSTTAVPHPTPLEQKLPFSGFILVFRHW
jgi:hypothetical protein